MKSVHEYGAQLAYRCTTYRSVSTTHTSEQGGRLVSRRNMGERKERQEEEVFTHPQVPSCPWPPWRRLPASGGCPPGGRPCGPCAARRRHGSSSCPR
ncbi:hypothetical protein EON64_15410 [archaeon]|nr:MAG: hypothetical protein EON64_15410 [archaeon]